MKKFLALLLSSIVLVSSCAIAIPAMAEVTVSEMTIIPAEEETTTETTTKKTVAKKTKKPPKSTKIKKVVAKKKYSFLIKWKKVKDIDGYQIQLATDPTFKKNKVNVKVKDINKTSKLVKNLKKNTYYYFRIRTYKTVDDKKLKSEWKYY